MDAFETYKRYVAINLHFDYKTKFDYFKAKGVKKCSPASFAKRSDRLLFEALARRRGQKPIDAMVVACIVDRGQTVYINDLLEGEAEHIESRFLGRVDPASLKRKLDIDWSYCLRHFGPDVPEWFEKDDELYPRIACAAMRREITPESFALIAEEKNAWGDMDESVGSDFTKLWPRWSYIHRALLGFLPEV